DAPAQAFDGARARLAAVREALRAGAVPARDVQISRSDLAAAYEGPYATRRFIGYRSESSLTILARDLAAIEPLLQAIVAAGALLSDVTYRTSALTRLRQQAREGAVAAARRKAEAYAGAAGVRVGRLLHLEDINPDDLSRRSHAPDIDLSADSDEEATTGTIRVAGAVMACFAILDG
ncbi:MAG: SIMPL domain-containing protein, partial [Myxococcales bacterium]|nr:SIMPL domain-containing protein [Myxococcales bacterium]